MARKVNEEKKIGSKRDADRKRKRKQKKEAKRKAMCSFFLLQASNLLVACIVRIRGSQLAKEKCGLQTHSFLITKPII